MTIDELIEKLRNRMTPVYAASVGPAPDPFCKEAAAALSTLQERNRKLEEALRDFLENPLYQVAVGGNPNAVDEMLARNRALLSGAGK